MGKKLKHVSETAGTYWVPDRRGRGPPKGVSKKQALKNARSAKTNNKRKLDPKQRGRAKQAKGKAGRKGSKRR